MPTVEELLGWLPLPPGGGPLTDRLRHTDDLTVAWWSGGETAVLDELIETWASVWADPAFAAAPGPLRAACHDRAAMARCWRAVTTSSRADLAAADTHLAAAATEPAARTDDLLYHRAIRHYSGSAVTGSAAEADLAVGILRDLVDRLPVADTRLRPRCLDVLGRSLLVGTRTASTVDEVIELLRDALAGFPPQAVYRGQVAIVLAGALGRRSLVTGRSSDLDAAIACLQDNPMVVAYGEMTGYRASQLGTFYGRRHRLLHEPEDLRRSLEWHARAVAGAPPRGRVRPVALTNYGNSLLWAYEQLGDPDLVERAVAAQEEAVAITLPDDPLYASRLNNLGNALSSSYELTLRPDLLDRAADLYDRALARTSAEDNDLPSRHYNAGNTALRRYELTGRRRHGRAAVAHYREACRSGMKREPEWALKAARQWGDWAADRGKWRAAVEPYEIAVQAIELLFGRQESRSYKEAWLRAADGLPARAGYALYRAGRPREAVAVQERSRALLLAEALRRDRVDEAPADPAPADRPLVYLDAAVPGGVALIVAGPSVRAVPLPALRDDAVRRRTALLHAAYAGRRADPAAWAGAVDAITRWAYDAVLGPVLDALPGRPVLTLVPVGALSTLPLHAAWEPGPGPGDRRYALDRTALSYAPTAAALAGARTAGTPRSALVVDEPAPVSAAPLPYSSVEGEAVTGALGGGAVRTLRGPAATRAAVLAEFGSHDLLHLSCHGIGRPADPLESGLVMAGDELLTLRDLYALPATGGPRLAVLSACETDRPGWELPDEVVSLPTGLLQAGCRGVVATQWSVPSLAAALLTARFYRLWPGGPATDPAVALAGAQRWLRGVTNAELAEQAQHALGLPADAARSVWLAARRRPPGERRFGHPVHWAAFAHVGS